MDYYHKYQEYKQKYFVLKGSVNDQLDIYDSILEKITDIIPKYKLIGIGEFSHGIEESWKFRFDMLKYVIDHTDKNIVIFNEMSNWQAENIMNNTIWSIDSDKFIKYDGIKIEKPVDNRSDKPSWGKLWQYVGHAMESNIFLEIIKYIRENKKRITIIGVDNDKLDRDYDMYQSIIKNLSDDTINFFWGHNHHVDSLKYHDYNMEYIENKEHKWYCGYYLKQKLKDKYCIILTQAYEGTNRFNGYCIGTNCETRTFQLKYFYKKFSYKPNKKYVDAGKQVQLLSRFNNKMINFSNSFFKQNEFGNSSLDNSNKWNYVIFWNKVHKLEPFDSYELK